MKCGVETVYCTCWEEVHYKFTSYCGRQPNINTRSTNVRDRHNALGAFYDQTHFPDNFLHWQKPNGKLGVQVIIVRATAFCSIRTVY